MNLWFVQHSTIAWILDASVPFFSALGILYLLYGTTLIPSPYRELHYSFPLYLNIVLLVNASYHIFLRTFRKDWISLQNFANMFLYPNGIACVFQLTIGMTSIKRNKITSDMGIRSPLYLVPYSNLSVFFTVPALMILFMRYIEKKRSQS